MWYSSCIIYKYDQPWLDFHNSSKTKSTNKKNHSCEIINISICSDELEWNWF